MENTVWYSNLMRDYDIGDKQGLADKWFGSGWGPPSLVLPIATPRELEACLRYQRGEPLAREEFPEAAYVFDEKRFNKTGELFMVGSFYAVKSKLAKILSRFDLGRGCLIPFPIFREDKVTRFAGEFYIWVLGAQKSGFVPDKSPAIKPWGLGSSLVEGVWDADTEVKDFDIAVSAAVVCGGPDVWCDPSLHRSLFFSDALVAAIKEAGIRTNFHLHRCRLI